MGKKIPATQRKQVMSILTKFEDKVEKGTDKKSSVTSKPRKEYGGLAAADLQSLDSGYSSCGAENPFSFAHLI